MAPLISQLKYTKQTEKGGGEGARETSPAEMASAGSGREIKIYVVSHQPNKWFKDEQDTSLKVRR